jgi:hypothetical protein
MPRPATKTDLIIAANGQFEKLRNLIDSMTDEKQNALFSGKMATMGKEAHWSRDKNLRDVLVHLNEWHQLLINWINVNRKGGQKPFLPEPYNWKNYPNMNTEFWKKHQSTALAEAKEMLQESHAQVMELIEIFSDNELFTKKKFPWTGSTSLGSYCISATSSHYDWAMTKIKIHIKN